MKIAFIDEDLSPRTGSRRFTYNVYYQLRKLGHEVHILTTRLDKETCFKEYLSIPVEVVSREKSVSQSSLKRIIEHHKKSPLIDFGNSLSYCLTQASLVVEMSRMIEEMECTMVMLHYHGEYWLLPYFYYLRKPVGVVYLNVLPPFPPPLSLPFQELTLRRRIVDRLINSSPVGRWKAISLKKIALSLLPSGYLLEQARRRGVIKPGKARVIPLGVDHSNFHPTYEEEPFALYLGRIHPHKSIELAIMAMRNTRSKLIIAGDLDKQYLWYKEKLVRLVEKAKISDKFELILSPSESEVIGMMQRCSVFLFPSTIDTFGLVVLEAMACGKPVVACDRGGVPEIIGDAGFCLEPDVSQWQQTVGQLLSNSRLRQQIGEKAFERSKAFSWESTTSKLLSVFHELNAS